MRLPLIALMGLSLAACQTVMPSELKPATTGLDGLKEVNRHIETCDRDYMGASAPIPGASFHIVCHPAAATVVTPLSGFNTQAASPDLIGLLLDRIVEAEVRAALLAKDK